MCANGNIFDRLNLDHSKFELIILEWFLPINIKESIENYALRFSKLINKPNAIILGVSFGGVIAIEIAKIIPVRKVILISSVKNNYEIPTYIKLAAKLRLYAILPLRQIPTIEKIIVTFGNKSTKKIFKQYQYYLNYKHPLHIQWVIKNLGNWNHSTNQQNIYQIHGTKDWLLPIKNIQPDKTLKNGTHAIIITKANTIGTIIESLF